MLDVQPVYVAATICRKKLAECLDIPRLKGNGWAENRLIEFNLWAAGAGISAKGKLSLDQRLSPKPELRNTIVSLLRILQMFIENCQIQARSIDGMQHQTKYTEKNNDSGNIEYLDGDSTREADTSGLLSKEIEAQKDVEVTLNQIVLLTVAIRKAGSDARLKRADRSFDFNSPKVQELKEFLELIVHPRGFKTEGQLNAIQLRLIEANLRRSHRFSYAKLHARNLARRDTVPEEGLLEGLSSNLQTSSKSDSNPLESLTVTGKDGATTINVAPREGAVSVIAPIATTAASAIEGTVIISDKAVVRTSATVISRVSSKVVYPRPPIVHNAVFKCPCCQQSLPDAYSERSQWKKHLTGDILPYTCVFQDCKQPLQLYLTREDWEHHITTDHGQYWSCAACEQIGKRTEFLTENELVDHLGAAHPDSVYPQEIPMFVTASSSSKPMGNIDCPLCPGPTDDEDSLDHIAHCIHDFSLYSLPLPSDSDADDEYFDIDSRNSNLLNTPSSHSTGREADDLVQSDYDGSNSEDWDSEPGDSLLTTVGYRYPADLDSLHSTDSSLSDETSTDEPIEDDDDHSSNTGLLEVNPNFRTGFKVDKDGNLDTSLIPDFCTKKGRDWIAYSNPSLDDNLTIDLVDSLEHDSVVYCVKFSPDGKYLATGCNRSAQIFDIKSGYKLASLIEQSVDQSDNYIRSVCFSPDGSFLVTGSQLAEIKIWNVEHRNVMHDLRGHCGDICSVEYSNDGRFISSGSLDGTVKVWGVPKSEQAPVMMASFAPEFGGCVTCTAMSPDSRLIAAGLTEGSIYVWEIFSGKLVEKLNRSYRISEGLDPSLERGIPHGRNEGHRDCVYSITFNTNGTGLISGSQDKTIKLWILLSVKAPQANDLKLGRLKKTLTGHDNFVVSVAQERNTGYGWLVSSSRDKRVGFWNPARNQPQLLLEGHKDAVMSIALSPEGGVLATGSSDFSVRIWRYWNPEYEGI